jgi:hypothetical protein
MISGIKFLVASLAVPGVQLAEQTPAEKAGIAPKLTIYLAKGAPDACVLGCDHWIAIEGEIDSDAAPRIRRFLAGVKSFAIGRLLRGRKAVARVGRTIVQACANGAQTDAACLKIKNASGEIEAKLSTRGAICNSACGFILLGATSREVAPDAFMGVHNSKYVFFVHGHPSAESVAEYKQKRIAIGRSRPRGVHHGDGHQPRSRQAHRNGEE